MISQLRRRHRWMAPVFLGIVPGIVLLTGIAGRPPAPMTNGIPAARSGVVEKDGRTLPLGPIWKGVGLNASIKRDGVGAQLILELVDPPLKPDLLLFWSPEGAELRASPRMVEDVGNPGDGYQLPEGSVLLGGFRETSRAVFDIPERAIGAPGQLILYSLPYRQVVSVSQPVNLN